MRKFADKLKELRKENEWTQKELADRLQITRASVASWETNRAEPSLTDLCRIAALFDESTDYLLGYDKGRSAPKEERSAFDSSKGKQVFDSDKKNRS
ncbi:MAG: helix-turn-helix transcriptional regulator [Christensenellales bacterium]